MRATIRTATLAGALLVGVVHAGPAFTVDELADGVLLFRPAAADKLRTNSLVVVRDDGLLVVDAQPTPGAARELLAAIAARTKKPVRYLVLTHPHAESAGGASAFPQTTMVVASEGYVESLEDESFDFAAEMSALAPEGPNEPPRRFPTLVVLGGTRLADPHNPVDLIPLGQRHSPGDLMIELPDSGVVHLGGLLFHGDRNPYARDAKVANWLVALNQAVRRNPRQLVGLRGEAVSVESVKKQRDALAWLRSAVDEAFIDRVPLEKMRARVENTPGFGNHFSRDPAPNFVATLIDRAIEESAAERRMRGML